MAPTDLLDDVENMGIRGVPKTDGGKPPKVYPNRETKTDDGDTDKTQQPGQGAKVSGVIQNRPRFIISPPPLLIMCSLGRLILFGVEALTFDRDVLRLNERSIDRGIDRDLRSLRSAAFGLWS